MINDISPDAVSAARERFDDEVDVFISEGNPAPAMVLYLMNLFEQKGLLSEVPDNLSVAMRLGQKTPPNWCRPGCAGRAAFALHRSDARWSMTSVSGLIRRVPKSLGSVIDQLLASIGVSTLVPEKATHVARTASMEDVFATFDMLPVNATLALLCLQSAFAKMHSNIDSAEFAKISVEYFVDRSLAQKGGINSLRSPVIDYAVSRVGSATKKTFLSSLKVNLNCDFRRNVLDRGDLNFFIAAIESGIISNSEIERRLPTYLKERPPEFISALTDQSVSFPEDWEEILQKRIAMLPAHKAKAIIGETIPMLRSTVRSRNEGTINHSEHEVLA